MTVQTVYGYELPEMALERYFDRLVDLVFKILPMREEEVEETDVYLESLMCELGGFRSLLPIVDYDAGVMEIMATIQYLKDNPDEGIDVVRREVFKAIRLCKLLRRRYAGGVWKPVQGSEATPWT